MFDNGGCLATNNVGSKGEQATREGSRSAIFVNSAAFVNGVVALAKSRSDPTWSVHVVESIGAEAREEVGSGEGVGVK